VIWVPALLLDDVERAEHHHHTQVMEDGISHASLAVCEREPLASYVAALSLLKDNMSTYNALLIPSNGSHDVEGAECRNVLCFTKVHGIYNQGT